jgi:LmbE family N-acetylglucosaminyl deacetylase
MVMADKKTALCIVAHPDDAEFQCAGTLALLAKKGWDIHIATMTPGDVGSVTLSREEISRVRRGEAANAAALLQGNYHCLECDDVFVLYDRSLLLKAIALIRKVRPLVVLAASPSDYMIDHEVAGAVAQTACLAAGITNIAIADTEPYKHIPHLYYLDPMAGTDKFGREIKSDILVDISSVIDTKEKMLCCHASQRNWLLEISKVDEYVLMMKAFAKKKGALINTQYAEGFRQHLGFSYPHSNILKAELGELVHV